MRCIECKREYGHLEGCAIPRIEQEVIERLIKNPTRFWKWWWEFNRKTSE